jgi:hypothetical protein
VMGRNPSAIDPIEERRHRSYPNSFATFWNQETNAGGI